MRKQTSRYTADSSGVWRHYLSGIKSLWLPTNDLLKAKRIARLLNAEMKK